MSTAIADSDNRFGGASLEGHEFDEKGIEHDAVNKEKKHYKNTEIHGYDLVDKSLTKELDLEPEAEIELSDLDLEGWNHKKKKAIHWEADYQGRYKELLKRLKKTKNT